METTKKSTFKILFYLKKNAPKKNEKVAIMCRITVNGKLNEIRSGIEECYSKIQKNEGTVNSAKSKNTFLGMDNGEITLFKFYEQL